MPHDISSRTLYSPKNIMMENILEDLECPICTDYLTIPIRQCSTGHSLCGKCIEKLDKCALCRSTFTDSRNITLEQLALKMKYPCINKNAGCTQLLAYPEREKHELRCNFRGFQTSCPMKGCDFLGNPTLIKAHWLAKKSSSKIFHTVNNSSTKLKNDSFYVNLVEGYGELFWYKSKTFNNNMYFAMQLLGKPEQCDQYYFEIEFNKAGFPKRKIILSNNCQSIQLNDKELFNEERCSVIGFGALIPFLVTDTLNYTMRLCKDKNVSGNKGLKNTSTSQTTKKPQASGKQGQNNQKKNGAKFRQKKTVAKPETDGS